MTNLITSLRAIAGDCADKTVAQDYGTAEGAKKAAETRKSHGGGAAQSPEQLDALARHNALQKANWEEMQSANRMDQGKENPYSFSRAMHKTDALMGSPHHDSGARFFAKGDEFGNPKPGEKLHNPADAGARAANREMAAQRRSLTMQRYLGGGETAPSLHDGMKPNPEPRVRSCPGVYTQYGTSVMMRKDGIPTREMPHWDKHDMSVREMNRRKARKLMA